MERSDEDKRKTVIIGKESEFLTPISHYILNPGRLYFRIQSAIFRLYGEIGYFDL